eukprot:5514191-Pleurochrysis_carterae.AAC.1
MHDFRPDTGRLQVRAPSHCRSRLRGRRLACAARKKAVCVRLRRDRPALDCLAKLTSLHAQESGHVAPIRHYCLLLPTCNNCDPPIHPREDQSRFETGNLITRAAPLTLSFAGEDCGWEEKGKRKGQARARVVGGVEALER